MGFLGRFQAEAYAVMRVVFGLLFLCHGSQKLFGFPGPPPQLPPPLLWAAGCIELVGGGLIAVGLFSRWAAFVCSGEMAVAYWIAHGPRSFFPLLNGGELAVLYCFVFLVIATNGPGIWSVDRRRRICAEI